MKIDRTILDDVAEEAPRLVPAVASVMPFLDLFQDEGEIAYDDEDEVYYGVDCDLPLPDANNSLPDMYWSAGIYEHRVVLLHLQKHGSVSRILGRENLSLREFWGILRQISEGVGQPHESRR